MRPYGSFCLVTLIEMQEAAMGFLSRLFGKDSDTKGAKRKTGNAQKDAGAGPALAAHSKDAKATGKTGQNAKAANTRAPAKPAQKKAPAKA